MICVSIGRGRHKQVILEHRHLVEQGAELVELRLDYIRRNVNFKRLLTNRPCPVVATCRRARDGGKWGGTEEQRLMMLRAAIADGVDYVDLEDDVADKIPRYGTTKRIISRHNFEETPENLQELHKHLASLDADIVKIATLAHNTHDYLRILRLVRDSTIPTIGIAMGEIGVPTRILAGKFGSPFSYATFHHERTLAPGQLSFEQMSGTYNYDSIDSETEVYGVIADPVGHSLSPAIHNAAFRDQQMNRVYVPFRVPRESLKEFISECPELGVRGLSVTIPHKEAVIPLLTDLDPVARSIGAVNTIIFDGDKRIGYNTDQQAAMETLSLAAAQDPQSDWLKDRVVLLLGAGGVAMAIGEGLKKAGAHLVIASRTFERADQLAKRLESEAIPWDRRHDVKAQILINGTPVGMHPNVDESPYGDSTMDRQMIVFDTVYNPEQTLLVKMARERGCRSITGVDMFIHQAALQFALFTGSQAPQQVMREKVIEMIGAARR
jgi:3-dehydroquinate dehydratase/shikimate dehydrogenase